MGIGIGNEIGSGIGNWDGIWIEIGDENGFGIGTGNGNWVENGIGNEGGIGIRTMIRIGIGIWIRIKISIRVMNMIGIGIGSGVLSLPAQARRALHPRKSRKRKKEEIPKIGIRDLTSMTWECTWSCWSSFWGDFHFKRGSKKRGKKSLLGYFPWESKGPERMENPERKSPRLQLGMTGITGRAHGDPAVFQGKLQPCSLPKKVYLG